MQLLDNWINITVHDLDHWIISKVHWHLYKKNDQITFPSVFTTRLSWHYLHVNTISKVHSNKFSRRSALSPRFRASGIWWACLPVIVAAQGGPISYDVRIRGLRFNNSRHILPSISAASVSKILTRKIFSRIAPHLIFWPLANVLIIS